MRINKFLYFGDFLAIPVALAVFVYCAYLRAVQRAAPRIFVSAAWRAVVWTLAEYWIHRVLYHQAPVFWRISSIGITRQPKALIGMPSFLSSGIVVVLVLRAVVRVRAYRR